MGLWRSSVKYILVFIENVEAIIAEFECSMFEKKNEYLKQKNGFRTFRKHINSL